MVLGEKLNSAVSNQIVRAKNVWHKAKGEETEPLLKHADSTTNQDDDDQTNGDTRKPTEQSPVTVREVLSVQSVTNLVIYTVLAMHSIGYDQVHISPLQTLRPR